MEEHETPGKVTQRSIIALMGDGKSRTIREILLVFGMNPAARGRDAYYMRALIHKCYKYGYLCEVLPRQGRDKLWRDARISLEDASRYPVTIDTDCIIFCSKKCSELFKFHHSGVFVQSKEDEMRKSSERVA